VEWAFHAARAAKAGAVELGCSARSDDEHGVVRAADDGARFGDGRCDGFPASAAQPKDAVRRAIDDPELAVRCQPDVGRMDEGARRSERGKASFAELLDAVRVKREDLAAAQHEPYGLVVRRGAPPTRRALHETELPRPAHDLGVGEAEHAVERAAWSAEGSELARLRSKSAVPEAQIHGDFLSRRSRRAWRKPEQARLIVATEEELDRRTGRQVRRGKLARLRALEQDHALPCPDRRARGRADRRREHRSRMDLGERQSQSSGRRRVGRTAPWTLLVARRPTRRQRGPRSSRSGNALWRRDLTRLGPRFRSGGGLKFSLLGAPYGERDQGQEAHRACGHTPGILRGGRCTY